MLPHRALRVFLIGSTLLALAFAGCLGSDRPTPTLGADAPPFVPAPPAGFDDPRGDADDVDVDTFAYGPGGCRFSGCPREPSESGPKGLPGAHQDILRVAFDGDDASSLRFSLRLSQVDALFAWLDPAPGVKRIGLFEVCYQANATQNQDRGGAGAGSASGDRCATLHVARDEGRPLVDATFHVYSDRCNEGNECAWDVEAEVVGGSPGTIRWTVPKAYALHDGAPNTIGALFARTLWYSGQTLAPAWHAAGALAIPGYHRHGHAGPLYPSNVADTTEAFPANVAFMPPPELALAGSDGPEIQVPPGSIYGGDSALFDAADLDLLALDLEEEADALVATFAMRSFSAQPDHEIEFMVEMGLSGGRVYEFGFFKATFETFGYVGRCINVHCDDSYMVKVPYEIRPGTPGQLVLRIPKAALGPIPPGTATTFLWAITMYSNYNVYADPAPGVHVDQHGMSLIDGHLGGRPFVFGLGHDGPEHPHEH